MIRNSISYERPNLDVEYDYVGIVDGLTPSDRATFGLTAALKADLGGAGIVTASAEVGTALELLGALEAFRREASIGRRFMIHFVSHGNADAIAAGAESVDWATMRPFLQRIHAETDGTLILNMSTCKGLHGVKSVDETGPYPFFGLIGAREDLRVRDALKANGLVYAKWLHGKAVQELVPEVNAEMGRDILFNISAEGYRQLSTD